MQARSADDPRDLVSGTMDLVVLPSEAVGC